VFDVVACGFAPADLPALPEAGTVRRLPAPSDATFLESAYDALREREPGRRVLVVHAAGREHTRRVHMVRSLLTTTDVVPIPVRRPPTGLAAATSWIGALAARGVSAGTAVAALADSLDRLPTYAVTTSVAGLDMREVRLGHHLLSWVPGLTFCVALDEAGPRVALGGVETGAVESGGPDAAGECVVVHAGDERLAGRLESTVPPGAARHRLPGEDTGVTWWRRARYYEHTLVPHDVDAFAEALRGRPLRPCPQCGDAMQGSCSFCHSLEGAHA